MRKAKALALLLACMICLTGCWDKVEIEDRAFVLVIGIDKAEEEGEDGDAKYHITFVNPDTTKAEEGKVNEYVTYDIQSSSYTLGITKLLQRFAQFHSYEHTKVLIFGREMMEDEKLFKGIIDAFNRGHQFNSSMLVYMTEGKAADVFKVKPKMKSLLAYYITGIADNERFATRIGKVTLLNFMRQLAENDGDGVIPSLEPRKDEISSSNLGIMKDYKHIAHMNGDETRAWKWLNGEAQGGVYEVKEGDISVPFTYFTFSRRIKLDKVEEGKIYLTYNLETEGSIEEFFLGEKLLDEEKLKSIETKLEQSIGKDSKDLVKKLQEEYKLDILGVRDYLSKYHPNLYKGIEKNFDEYFETKIVIEVKVDVKVRRIGKSE